MESAMTMAIMNKCKRTTARPHIVLGRGHVGGIWADMGQDHNQTLSYHEHMELSLYLFKDSSRNKDLERPLLSMVSAYYKTYIQQLRIQSNFSDNTTVT
ncbi:Oxidative stress-induced growth inhibitor 2, partial [Modicella reniformis]